MDRLIERVVGLDVHKATLKACVRVPDEQGGRRSETRTFRATTPLPAAGPLCWRHGPQDPDAQPP